MGKKSSEDRARFGWSRALQAGVAATGLLLLSGQAAADSESASDPDVVVILIDTLRSDRTSLYGADLDTTPYIDQLAEDGVVFTRANSTASHTAPSTASLFTSVYPVQHGIVMGFWGLDKHQFDVENQGWALTTLSRIPDDLLTMPELFKAAGYQTFGVAANVNIGEEMGFADGFDRFKLFAKKDRSNPDYQNADVLVDQVIAWQDEIQGEAPAFVYLHFMDPHAPHAKMEPWFEDFSKQSKREKGTPLPVPERAYASEIAFVDQQISRLFEHFDWEDSAVVLLVADHGEEFEDHGGRGHGHTLYREVLDVMFMIRAPGAGLVAQRVDDTVSLVDALPTLVDVAGLPPQPHWAGLSLGPRIRPGADVDAWSGLLSQRAIFATVRKGRNTVEPLHAVMQGDLKLVGWPGEYELYDRSQDFAEQQDLASERGEQVSSLTTLLDGYVATPVMKSARTVEVELDADTMEQLRELGYVE